ncbi:DUF2497 domain-containing protein [Kiloniella sp.]|uniref:DUF2497 domain-containing protein n=1 Tax=Kiloniella sp. TaxID=1938587 RepID=UPI003B01FFA5
MSDQEAQGEPSMEEILASIRRIISEDDPEGEGEGTPASEAPEEAAPEEPETEDDDILDLTEEVEEEEIVAEVEEPVEPEDSIENDFRESMEEPEEEAEEVIEIEEEIDEVSFEEVEESFEPEPEPEPEPELESEPEIEEVDLDLDIGEDIELDAPDADSILQEITQDATSSALSEIARAAVVQRSLAIGTGKTLEDIVREALVPELKAWLDVRLGPMVERIVREEIKKMVRRAEDL